MSVAVNLAGIKERIAAAAARCGRNPDEIRLVAVSKRQPVEKIASAIAAGHRLFGENYLQEARDKVAALPDAEFHFIGHLQSNKAKEATGMFSLIHTVDRLKLARRISARALELGIVQDVLVQVNVGRDPNKSGIAPEELEPLLAGIGELDGIAVRGLMTMPPQGDMAGTRVCFAALRSLAEKAAADGLIPAGFELSMGMSGDFEAAIAEGATLVRVGTAVFGPRG